MSKKNKTLYLIFLFVFTFVCFELGARYYLGVILEKSLNNKFQFNSYRVYEHVPGYEEVDENGDKIIINKNGFRRSEDVNKEKSEDVYRIFLLGGSAAHGISCAAPYPIVHIYQNQTIDAYLEAKLKAEHPDKKIEVINAAVTGYQVFQHTEYILTELLDYSPDLMIFFDGANDHYSNNPDFDFYLDFRYQYWKERLQQPSIVGLFSYFANYMSQYSALFRGYYAWSLQRDAYGKENVWSMYLTFKNKEERIEMHKLAAKKLFLKSIEHNLQLLQAEGIESILCLQPMLVLRDSTLMSDQEKSFLHKDLNVQILYPYVVKEVSELAQSYSTMFIDFNTLFNNPLYKSEQLLIDYCHLSPRGGEVVADSLQRYISTKIFKDKTIAPKSTISDTLNTQNI